MSSSTSSLIDLLLSSSILVLQAGPSQHSSPLSGVGESNERDLSRNLRQSFWLNLFNLLLSDESNRNSILDQGEDAPATIPPPVNQEESSIDEETDTEAFDFEEELKEADQQNNSNAQPEKNNDLSSDEVPPTDSGNPEPLEPLNLLDASSALQPEVAGNSQDNFLENLAFFGDDQDDEHEELASTTSTAPITPPSHEANIESENEGSSPRSRRSFVYTILVIQRSPGSEPGSHARSSFMVVPFGFPPFSAGHHESDSGFDDLLHHLFMNAAGPKSQPVSKSVMETLPLVEVDEELKETCTVCQEVLVAGEKVLQLPCRHHYHKDCIQPWFNDHNTCPSCRFELPVEDESEKQKKVSTSPTTTPTTTTSSADANVEDEMEVLEELFW